MPNWPCSPARPTGSGRFSPEGETISGQSRSFHEYSPVSTVSAASVGLAIGSMTCQKTWKGLAPSSRAASSKSCGMFMKACRIRKVPKAENMPGMASAGRVSSSPKSRISPYWPIRKSWLGTISIARNSPNSAFLPGNGSRAKA